MSTPAEVRASLTTALAVVLPGRVYAHPPTSGRYVTPSVFVEQFSVSGDITEPIATFPVWIVADGAVEAQIAAHDGIVWNVLLAVWPQAQRVTARSVPVAGLRATVVEVDISLDVFTLCGAPPAVAYERATLAG